MSSHGAAHAGTTNMISYLKCLGFRICLACSEKTTTDSCYRKEVVAISVVTSLILNIILMKLRKASECIRRSMSSSQVCKYIAFPLDFETVIC